MVGKSAPGWNLISSQNTRISIFIISLCSEYFSFNIFYQNLFLDRQSMPSTSTLPHVRGFPMSIEHICKFFSQTTTAMECFRRFFFLLSKHVDYMFHISCYFSFSYRYHGYVFYIQNKLTVLLFFLAHPKTLFHAFHQIIIP